MLCRAVKVPAPARVGKKGKGGQRLLECHSFLQQLWPYADQLPRCPHYDITSFIGLGPFQGIFYGNGRLLLSHKATIYRLYVLCQRGLLKLLSFVWLCSMAQHLYRLTPSAYCPSAGCHIGIHSIILP